MSALRTLRDFAAYLRREAERRAKGSHPGVVRLRDDEIAALLELLTLEIKPRGGANE